MIKDKLSNSSLYDSVHPLFKAAFQWLTENGKPEIPDGRLQLDGDKLVAIPQHYKTHAFDSKKFEVHQKYIDIQFIVSGSEKIYLGNPSEMTTAVPFNPEKDIAFLDGRGPAVNLDAGEFMIIWPHEAHEPCADPDLTAIAVHKIIIKVAV